MANPFDQFDGQTATNPFDQFDGPPAGSPPVKTDYGSPTDGNSFAKNALIGSGKFFTDMGLGARQIAAQPATADLSVDENGNLIGTPHQITPQELLRVQQLQQEAAEKRHIDAPIMATGGGKVGTYGTAFASAIPLSAIPGAGTVAGSAVIGGGYGALEPVVDGESRGLNTVVGAGAGAVGNVAGTSFSNWLSKRASQPFMGWGQSTGNRAAAGAVGSDAAKLDQPAIAEANSRLGGIFTAARNPNSIAQLDNSTLQAVDSAASGLNKSSSQALWSNQEVSDLLDHAGNGSANAQQLGQLSSRLGKEASSQMSSKDGDRALGSALFEVKNHVDQLVGATITDPELAAQYAQALPQYRTLSMLAPRPALLNSSTGDVNLSNVGKFLQRTDNAGYRQGGNQSDFYNAARWGQAAGQSGKPAPSITEPINFAAYYALNNPVVKAAGGVASRALPPIAPYAGAGFPGLAGIALPYLSQ